MSVDDEHLGHIIMNGEW